MKDLQNTFCSIILTRLTRITFIWFISSIVSLLVNNDLMTFFFFFFFFFFLFNWLLIDGNNLIQFGLITRIILIGADPE